MKKAFLLLVCLNFLSLQAQIVRKRTVKLMGSRFDITISAKSATEAEAYIDSAIIEIERIENVISEWREETLVSEINRNAGIKPVKVTPELFGLTERALQFSKMTDGAFDISFASMDKIWKYDGSMTAVPSEESVKKSVQKVGYKNIILDKKNSTIFLKLPGMKIGFGSIGKGYAADKTKELMISKGVPAGIINASGDMNTWGKQPDGKEWTVGITNPMNQNKVFATFPLSGNAVVTSGDYEKFVILEGKKYSHIIDPRTGYPARGISSVTVFASSAELANGFSTSIMVMGKEAGLNLINQIPGMSCVIVDENGHVSYSDAIDIKKYQQ
ncbi:FAD:protein FMN transferase [Flavobacterium microcysteis]